MGITYEEFKNQNEINRQSANNMEYCHIENLRTSRDSFMSDSVEVYRNAETTTTYINMQSFVSKVMHGAMRTANPSKVSHWRGWYLMNLNDFDLEQSANKFTEEYIKQLILRYNLTGDKSLGITKPKSGKTTTYYVYSPQNNLKIVYIPDSTTLAPELNWSCNTSYVKVIGGRGLHRADYLFSDMDIFVLDLTLFYLGSAVSMANMFRDSTIQRVIFGKNLSTNNVSDFSTMFGKFKTMNPLDLGMFNTKNGKSFNNMFYFCSIPELNLSSFEINQYADTSDMFKYATTHVLIGNNPQKWLNFS